MSEPWYFSQKVEVLSSLPLVVIFHQILNSVWSNVIKNAAKPDLEAPKTVSTHSGTIKSAAEKRAGKNFLI